MVIVELPAQETQDRARVELLTRALTVSRPELVRRWLERRARWRHVAEVVYQEALRVGNRGHIHAR